MCRFLALLAVIALPLTQAQAVTDAQISDAMKRMQVYLLSQQDPLTGGWEKSYANHTHHRGGETALVTFALLRSGLSVQEPEVHAAVGFLQALPIKGTYAVSLRAHCWAALSDDYRAQLAADAKWLLHAQVDGLFDYGPRTGPRYDHSVTQYGLLGLWESAKRQGPNAGGVWQHSSQHFIEKQNPDGGWGYNGGSNSTRSMTAAGLTSLLIAQERLYLSRNKPPPKVAQAIRGATAWLDRYAKDNGLDGRGDMYFLVSLERAALASGIKNLGGHDWFDTGATAILEQERGTGSMGSAISDTALALVFLSHGKEPVWINKLRLPGQAWNNRPNDLNILTRKLGNITEAQLNWQVVEIDADPLLWLDAPVAYVASDTPLDIGEAAMASLKTYLDLGGILVATPDNAAPGFDESVREIAKKLYPDLAFERAGPDHPLMGLVFPVELTEDNRPWVLSNGVRDLIVLAPLDWGMSFQSSRTGKVTGARHIMANLHALVSDRARTDERLHTPIVARDDTPSRGELMVTRAVPPGRDVIEPLAWLPLVNHFYNRTGLELTGQQMPLDQIDRADTPLVYLGGSDVHRLSAEQLRGLVKYVNRGGTILIETIGGRGGFTDGVLRQLQAVFGAQAAPLDADHPIITGRGLTGGAGGSGGYDQRKVGYRRYSTLNKGLLTTPRLEAIRVDGRPVVIASREDLSLGVMGSQRWGIDGYDTDSARGLVSNILLYTARGKRQHTVEASVPSVDQGTSRIEAAP